MFNNNNSSNSFVSTWPHQCLKSQGLRQVTPEDSHQKKQQAQLRRQLAQKEAALGRRASPQCDVSRRTPSTRCILKSPIEESLWNFGQEAIDWLRSIYDQTSSGLWHNLAPTKIHTVTNNTVMDGVDIPYQTRPFLGEIAIPGTP